MIYIVLILLLVYLSYYYDYRQNVTGRTFWILIVTFIFIAMGTLHYRVGGDTVGYERFYENLTPLNYIRTKEIESSRFAPGFVILASFSKLFSPDLVLLNFFYSTFVCGVAVWFFNKHTKHLFFALLMFFIFSYVLLIFEQIREALAVGVFLLAWQYFVKRKWIYWYALSFLAILFHTSATIMFILPIILMPGVRQLFIFGKRTFIISAILLALAFVLAVTFSKYIQLLAVTDSMDQLTQKYSNTSYVEGKMNFIGVVGHLIKNIFYPLWALLCLMGTKDKIDSSPTNKCIVSFTIISIYISILSVGVPIFIRYNNYFFFFPIVIVSDWVFNYIKVRNRKVRFKFAYWMVIVLPMFLLQLYSYTGKIDRTGKYRNYMIYYPFTTYLDKEKDQNKERAIMYVRKHM